MMSKIKFQLVLTFFLISTLSFSQVLEETILLDTIIEKINVIYKPIISSTYYFKKTAVFANDTSQVAIEKSFTSYGQNGLYKVFYPSGRLRVKTVFANNNINGEWSWYDEKGTILVKGIYKDGVKHGFWAYKWLKIYGRYKKGLRNGKWYELDPNEKKIKSHYKNGILMHGKGFGDENRIPFTPVDSNNTNQNTIVSNDNAQLIKEFEQAISFLTVNIAYRKALKEHFGKGDLKEIRAIKKHFVKDKFQFSVAPTFFNLENTSFLQESKEGKIVVSTIDSILKLDTTYFDDVEKLETIKKVDLSQYSTNTASSMTVYFGKTAKNIWRIDVVRFNEPVTENDFENKYKSATATQKFQILLYFENGKLKGAEYEKP